MPIKKKKTATPVKESAVQDTPELSLIRKLAAILNETGLTDIELDHKGARVRVSKNVMVAASVSTAPVAHVAAAAAAPVAAAPVARSTGDHPGSVKSPMVGTSYLAPTPGTPNFVAVGDTVKQGQTLLIIEAMKTMNPIPAPRNGKVVQILIENAQPIEFGQVLFVIE
jgi:acetyl-CoA carboxylase biotin carboxyl carrier protein